MINLLSPISPASEKTGRALFQQFRLGKWFALGFSAWLASFIGASSSFSGGSSSPDKATANIHDGYSLVNWGLPTWLAIIAGIAVVVWLFIILFAWLGCRGQFMMLDNVLHDRSEIKTPWHTFRKLGNSLFQVYFVFWNIVFILGLGAVFYAVVFLWPDFLSGHFHGWRHYLPLIITGAVFILISVSASIVLLFVREFGSLWMYRHDVSGWEALRKVLTLATEEPVSFIVYIIVRIVMGILFFIVALLLGCLTCCLGFLPYLSSVVTLPISVFLVWYNVHCFAQFGSEYDVTLMKEQPPALPQPPGLIG